MICERFRASIPRVNGSIDVFGVFRRAAVDLLDIESAQFIYEVMLVVKQSAENVEPNVAGKHGEHNQHSRNTRVTEPPLIDDYESIDAHDNDEQTSFDEQRLEDDPSREGVRENGHGHRC